MKPHEKLGAAVGLTGAVLMMIGIGYLVWHLPKPFGTGLTLILGGGLAFGVGVSASSD